MSIMVATLQLVPTEARRKRSDFEVALASQLQPSAEEQKVFGMVDHYGLSEHEKEVGARKVFRTADEEVGFQPRTYGPPGLAEPLLVSNSSGNHRFHSYNGTWRNGKMHGVGKYRFADDTEYTGNWVDGKREGDVDVSSKVPLAARDLLTCHQRYHIIINFVIVVVVVIRFYY